MFQKHTIHCSVRSACPRKSHQCPLNSWVGPKTALNVLKNCKIGLQQRLYLRLLFNDTLNSSRYMNQTVYTMRYYYHYYYYYYYYYHCYYYVRFCLFCVCCVNAWIIISVICVCVSRFCYWPSCGETSSLINLIIIIIIIIIIIKIQHCK